MRGEVNPQGSLLLAGIAGAAQSSAALDQGLRGWGAPIDPAGAEQEVQRIGRPSIPPERKSSLPMALYSVRCDRLFCETLGYNILFRWFLDRSLEEASFAASTFRKNRERLVEHEGPLAFLDAVVRAGRRLALLSDEHFSVDGTLLEAWASMKSFQRKDGRDRESRRRR